MTTAEKETIQQYKNSNSPITREVMDLLNSNKTSDAKFAIGLHPNGQPYKIAKKAINYTF